jgi:hypothetical protein
MPLAPVMAMSNFKRPHTMGRGIFSGKSLQASAKKDD